MQAAGFLMLTDDGLYILFSLSKIVPTSFIGLGELFVLVSGIRSKNVLGRAHSIVSRSVSDLLTEYCLSQTVFFVSQALSGSGDRSVHHSNAQTPCASRRYRGSLSPRFWCAMKSQLRWS